jgi:hypothetical protein
MYCTVYYNSLETSSKQQPLRCHQVAVDNPNLLSLVMILRVKCNTFEATWNLAVIRYQVSGQYCWFCLAFLIV